MEDADLVDGDLLTNEVEINLNVLYVLVLYVVGREVNNDDVVLVDKRDLTKTIVKLLKQLAQPAAIKWMHWNQFVHGFHVTSSATSDHRVHMLLQTSHLSRVDNEPCHLVR
jgi:hypothetical protein